MTMKVHKVSSRSQHKQRNATKRHNKNKWHKKVRSLDSTLPNTSPGTAKLEQQIAKSEKPTVKRLQKLYTKPVTFIPKNSCAEEEKVTAPSVTSAHVHTNGGTELDDSSTSVDSKEWSEYANSVLQNGKESSNTELPDTDKQEEDDLQFHAHLDHTNNRAVLVMKPGQVD